MPAYILRDLHAYKKLLVGGYTFNNTFDFLWQLLYRVTIIGGTNVNVIVDFKKESLAGIDFSILTRLGKQSIFLLNAKH